MAANFPSYLEMVGITDLFLKRTEESINFFSIFCSIEVTDIFVSEYIDDDGKRQYESLWLFNPKLFMESKNFLTSDNYDAAPIYKRIGHWEVSKDTYDLKNPSEKSRMTVNFVTLENVNGILKASGENCNALRDVFLKYFLTNTCE